MNPLLQLSAYLPRHLFSLALASASTCFHLTANFPFPRTDLKTCSPARQRLFISERPGSGKKGLEFASKIYHLCCLRSANSVRQGVRLVYT